MTSPGRQARWWALGGTLTLAAVLTGAFALRATGPACAAAAAVSGRATFYDGDGGNCSYPGAPADRLFVALGPAEYAAGAACGGYLDVKGPRGTVRVKVTDQCPECAAGHIDLSREAFARIADPAAGVVPVTYSTVVSPRTPALTFRIKEGASRWWFAVLVDNTGNALRRVEARGPGGAWRTATRTDYNYWIVEKGLGPGPFTIRVTDVRGRTATATGVTLSPGRTQTSTARLGGGGAPAPERTRTSPRPSARAATPAAAPARTAAPSATPTGAAALDAAAGLGSRRC